MDVIVLCIPDPSDLDIYEQVLPLYFPRTEEEEREVLPKVPENVGNERGESLMSHRDIRISEMPTGAPRGPDEAQAVRRDSSTSSMASNQDLPKPKEALSEISGWSSDFTQMTESPDSKRNLDGSPSPGRSRTPSTTSGAPWAISVSPAQPRVPHSKPGMATPAVPRPTMSKCFARPWRTKRTIFT